MRGGVCLASLRHISGVERILPEGQNTLVFWLSGFLRRQTYWYDRDKCPNGLRYDGDGGPELDSET